MFSTLIDNQSTLLFGGLVCIVLAVQNFVHARVFPQFQRTTLFLSIGTGLGFISLVGAALAYDVASNVRTIAVSIPGILSYLFAVLCAVSLYQPNKRPKFEIGTLVVFAVGAVLIREGALMDAWTSVIQCVYNVVILIVIVRNKEPHAPMARRVLIASLTPLLIATILHVDAMLRFTAQFGSNAWNGHYEPGALIVLCWAFAPFLFCSAMFTIINGRIASHLRELADYDGLTGLKVRRRFFEESKAIVARRNENAGEIAAMMIDIDHFKSINDRFGHASGDLALQHCASLIASTIRPDTLVCRFGGEEFCVLSHIDHREEGHAIAERIRAKVAATPIRLGDELVPLSVSIGVAFHDAPTTLEALFDKADRHLYAAKRGGRNRVMSFDIGPELAPVV